MSCNKNTINRSVVDNTIETLKIYKIPYKITILGKVTGFGLNDITFEEDIKNILHKAHKVYEIRKLKYKDVVILEHMIRNKDCDVDDCIMSYEFKRGYEPKDWKIEENYE